MIEEALGKFIQTSARKFSSTDNNEAKALLLSKIPGPK
jgi:hypothetical protein